MPGHAQHPRRHRKGLSVVTGEARDYDVVDPESVGVSTDRLGELIERAHREIESGLLPSCQLALAREGKLVAFETLGDAESGSRYIIFSMTKGVVAGAVWILVGEDKIAWSDKVVDFIPEFATNGKENITVEQLLTHTSGFPQAPMNLDVASTREGRIERFGQWRLNWEPGTRFEYHPLSAHWVLGEIVTRVSGADLRDFVADRIFGPLGLSAFSLGEPETRQSDINDLAIVGELPTPEEVKEVFGVAIDLEEVRGEVTDEALMAFNDPAARDIGAPGGGGISTAADIALYYQEMLHNTSATWDPEVIKEGIEPINELPDPIRGIPAHRSRGLMVAGEPPEAQFRGFGHNLSPQTFGHDGAGGQIAWADPESGLSFCYLTNGLDAHIIRQGRRTIGLSSRAAVCA